MRLTFLILILMTVFSTILKGQEYEANHELRQIRVWENEEDTIIIKIKKSKDGEIKKLIQTYHERLPDGNYDMIKEHYVEGKFWVLWRAREVVVKQKKKYSTIDYIPNGLQYEYDEFGRLIYITDYKMGEPKEPSTEFRYYPNGALKCMLEIKEDKIWNVVKYKLPNGKDYIQDGFKDGEGVIVHLNDEGEPCLECTTIEDKTRGRRLCDEDL